MEDMSVLETVRYKFIRWYRQVKLIIGIEKVKCNRCHLYVAPSENIEYTYQCFECDEDLFSFETYIEKGKGNDNM